MRRPLCAFCAGMMGLSFLWTFLPQTELFMPFAAFFVAFLLLLCIPRRSRKLAVCLLLGALGIADMGAAIFADVGVMVIAVLNAMRALHCSK